MQKERGQVVGECETLDWAMNDCYGESWGDLIVGEAFAHP